VADEAVVAEIPRRVSGEKPGQAKGFT